MSSPDLLSLQIYNQSKGNTGYTLRLIWKTPWKVSEFLSTKAQRDMVMTSLNKQIYMEERAGLSFWGTPGGLWLL